MARLDFRQHLFLRLYIAAVLDGEGELRRRTLHRRLVRLRIPEHVIRRARHLAMAVRARRLFGQSASGINVFVGARAQA